MIITHLSTPCIYHSDIDKYRTDLFTTLLQLIVTLLYNTSSSLNSSSLRG